MSNFNRLSEVKLGFALFSKHPNFISYPAKLFPTPGVSAKSLYSAHVPLYTPTIKQGTPFCSENELVSVTGGDGSQVTSPTGTFVKLESPSQVGHGKVEEDEPMPPNENSVKEETSMKEILDKLNHPVYDVKTVKVSNKIKKSKDDEDQPPAKKKRYIWY